MDCQLVLMDNIEEPCQSSGEEAKNKIANLKD
jgi:hypothetical protein